MVKIRKSWLKMESEHTHNRFQQEKIVRDHIKEFGTDYYPMLKKLERKLKKK